MKLPKGIRKTRSGYQAYFRVFGRLVTKRFPKAASVTEMKAWREATRVDLRRGRVVAARGTFGDDVARYCEPLPP